MFLVLRRDVVTHLQLHSGAVPEDETATGRTPGSKNKWYVCRFCVVLFLFQMQTVNSRDKVSTM